MYSWQNQARALSNPTSGLIYFCFRKYNDISNWNWTGLFSVLGDSNGNLSQTCTTHTKRDLSKLLDDTTFASASKIQLVEVMMDKFDAPNALREQAVRGWQQASA